jgi:hypothetical protein
VNGQIRIESGNYAVKQYSDPFFKLLASEATLHHILLTSHYTMTGVREQNNW